MDAVKFKTKNTARHQWRGGVAGRDVRHDSWTLRRPPTSRNTHDGMHLRLARFRPGRSLFRSSRATREIDSDNGCYLRPPGCRRQANKTRKSRKTKTKNTDGANHAAHTCKFNALVTLARVRFSFSPFFSWILFFLIGRHQALNERA